MSVERQSTLTRRGFLSLAAAAAAGGVLAACTPKPAATATPEGGQQPAEGEATQVPEATAVPAKKEGLKLSFWVTWPEYEGIIPKFRAAEGFKKALGDNEVDIQIDVETEVFLTNVAAGTAPDIACPGGYFDYMVRGVLLPLDDLVAKSTVIKKEDFIEGNWNGCIYKGALYGVPANECFVRRGLNYNVRMVADADLDPEKPPVTWAETFEWHKKLTKFDASGNMLQIGLDPYDAEGGAGGGGDGFFLADSWNIDWFNPETGQFNLDNEKMAEGLEVMGEFVKFVGPDKMAGMRAVQGQGTWGGSFNAQVQAMIIEGYWHPGETTFEMPEVGKLNRATWVPVPENRRGVKIQVTGGHMVIFFKDAQHPKEAFPIAEFLATKEACDILFKTLGWLPALKTYIAEADPSTYPGLDFYFRSVKEATEWHEPVRCPIGNFVGTKFEELRESVFRGEMSGAEAAKQFQTACEEEWKASGAGA